MPIKWAEHSHNSFGGTELSARRLESFLQNEHPDLFNSIDIHPSRVRNFDPNRKSVLVLHDLPNDPEAAHLANGGANNWDLLAFVSHWQYQQFQQKFNLDGYNCTVIPNGIDEYKVYKAKWETPPGTKDNPIKFVYHTTPHRGIDILLAAFQENKDKLEKIGIYITLDVFSSFEIYGWGQKDEMFQQLFDICKNTDGITYHGFKPHKSVMTFLHNKAHVFLFPSTHQETYAYSLVEAMACGVYCVHSDLGCLAETSGGLTDCYTWKSNPEDHKEVASYLMYTTALKLFTPLTAYEWQRLKQASDRVNTIYSWEKTIKQKWEKALRALDSDA